MKLFIVILFSLVFFGCSKDSSTAPSDKSEFVLNRIHCSFTVYTMIDSSAKDTTIGTEMFYGLDGYFHLEYGLIKKQIVSFNGYVDTIDGSNVYSAPDIHNLPVWRTKYTVPNVLGELDSTKIVVKIYGAFYSDNTYQKSTGDFYRQDSSTVWISRLMLIHP